MVANNYRTPVPVNYMVHYTLILEGKYRLSIGRLSFPHTCDRAQQKQKRDILVYSNMLFTQTFSNWKLIWTTCTTILFVF